MKELKIFNVLEGKILIFHLVWALSFAFPVVLDSSIKKNKRVKTNSPISLSFLELTAVELLLSSL